MLHSSSLNMNCNNGRPLKTQQKPSYTRKRKSQGGKSRSLNQKHKVDLRQTSAISLNAIDQNNFDLNDPVIPNKNPNLFFIHEKGVSALEQARPQQ